MVVTVVVNSGVTVVVNSGVTVVVYSRHFGHFSSNPALNAGLFDTFVR